MPFHECAILFLHHRDDAMTRHHYGLIRRFNPFPVIPIHRGDEGIGGAVNVATPDTDDEKGWGNTDLHVVNWFRLRQLRAKRYVIVENDVFATMPFDEYFKDVWDADLCGMNVQRRGRDDWPWFRQARRLPKTWRECGVGISPLSVFLISHRALKAVSRYKRLPRGVMCEYRLPTAACTLGFEVVEHPWGKRTNHYKSSLLDFRPEVPGVYHPVKKIVPPPLTF